MKYFGITLIVTGVLFVVYAVFFSVGIFVQGNQPPEIFKEQEVSLSDMMSGGMEEGAEEDALAPMGEGATIENVFPISKMLNIFAASMFAMILIFGGAKLTEMGVRVKKGD